MDAEQDWSRFNLDDEERPVSYFDLIDGLEGLFTDRRFIYRWTHTGEQYAFRFNAIMAVGVDSFGFDYDDRWPWHLNVQVRVEEPVEHDDAERRDFGDYHTIAVPNVRLEYELGARLTEAMIAAHPGAVAN